MRRNEVVSFVSGGLRDLSISRTSFDWGVKVPDHPDHVMYVWVDALTNYLTGVGYPDTESEMFRRYWPADLHMIGRTSSGSTPCTGRRFSCRPESSCPEGFSRTGFCSTAARR